MGQELQAAAVAVLVNCRAAWFRQTPQQEHLPGFHLGS